MDPRRPLTLCAAACALASCSHLPHRGGAEFFGPPPGPARTALLDEATVGSVGAANASLPTHAPSSRPAETRSTDVRSDPAPAFAGMAPIPNPGRRGRGLKPLVDADAQSSISPSGPAAIAAANLSARETSRTKAFLGGVQVFVYDPGRVYEVWTAPLRVTTLTMSRGEVVISKAAGDTVRWQIGETQSGEGPEQRAHVMIKPLARGLETNLVVATNRRLYLVELRSGDQGAFNTAVTWDMGSLLDAVAPASNTPPAQPALAAPQGPLDAGFRIKPKGRAPAWTPSAVATDGVHTFISFPPGLTAGAAPALFDLGPTGEVELVNYRQQGELWVVDRVLTAAELRMGGRRAQIVRIERIGASL